MATNYNITQKQYNGTDYDILYPKNTSQQVLLNDSTIASTFGLSGTPTVNDVLSVLASQGLRYKTGNYTGTGTAGSANPTSITFTFTPKMVFVYGGYYYGSTGLALVPFYYTGNEQGTSIVTSSGSLYTLNYSWNGNTLSWWSLNDSATTQLNESPGNHTYNRGQYYWIAIY